MNLHVFKMQGMLYRPSLGVLLGVLRYACICNEKTPKYANSVLYLPRT